MQYGGARLKNSFSIKNKDGKAFYNVGSIIEDRKRNIWFGGSIIKDRKRISDKGTTLTVEAGLWRYDSSTYTTVSQTGASAIIEDKKETSGLRVQ